MIDELYGAVTVIARLQHRGAWDNNVELEWVSCDRAQPIAPYASLIADYGQFDQTERMCAEQYMDNLFTKAEYRMLRRYLKDHHPTHYTSRRARRPTVWSCGIRSESASRSRASRSASFTSSQAVE